MSEFTSSFRAAHSKRTRTISEKKIKALVSAHRDRDRKKRDFRSLWISRINAIIDQNKKNISNIYNQFVYNLYKSQLLLNRKLIAQIAILKGTCLFLIAKEIRSKNMKEVLIWTIITTVITWASMPYFFYSVTDIIIIWQRDNYNYLRGI